MKQLLVIFFLLYVWSVSHAQDAVVSFRSDEAMSVKVYKPVEHFYHDFAFAFDSAVVELHLSPDSVVSCSIPVDKQAVVFCQFSNMLKYRVYLLPGSRVQLNIVKGNIHMEGDYAKGIETMNTEWEVDKYLERQYTDSVVINNTKDSVLHIQDILNVLLSSKSIDSIGERIRKKEPSVSPEMLSMFCKEAELYKNNQILYWIRVLKGGEIRFMRGEKVIRHLYTVSSADSLYMNWISDSILTALPISEDLLRLSNGSMYISRYAEYRWRQMSKSERQAISGNYSPDTFGPYNEYLLLPSPLQEYCLAEVYIAQLKYKTHEINRSKLLQYMRDKFPNSFFTQYLCNLSSEKQPVQSHVITDEIHSLKDLLQQEKLKGKPLFIDLWATWCMPCREEFQYSPKLYKTLNEMNVNILYLSIDLPNSRKEWEKCTNDLSGCHLLASDKLQKEIKAKVYENKPFAVPRYLLLDADGNIINGDLPRPSQFEQLISTLKKCLGK